MNRSNWKQRLQNVARGTTRPAASRQGTSGKRKGRLPLFMALGLIGFLVLAAGASLARRATSGGPQGQSVTGLTANVPQPAITGAAAMEAPLDLFANNQPGNRTEAKVPGAVPATGGGSAEQAGTQPGNDWDRLIIRTATLQMKVDDVGAGMNAIRSLADGHAGYVTQSDSHQEGDLTVATITIQVPSRQFDATVSQLRKLGVKVLNENVTSSDVTEEFTDRNSQLRNLQATEARILALTQKAEKIEDILALDRELRSIQGEIERTQGRVNFLSKRAEMSTITVSLYPNALPDAPVKVQADGWNPLQVATEAWNASLELLAGVGTLVITVAVFLWWAVPVSLIAMWLLRRYRRSLPPPPTSAPAEM